MWQTVSNVLFWFALILYVIATVLYAYQFMLRRPKAAWWARFATGAGFLAQTLSIGANSIARGGTPYFTGGYQLMLLSWALVLLYFIFEHVIKLKVYGSVLIPIAVVLMVVSRLMPSPPGGVPNDAVLESWRVAVHVALIIFANAGFAIGAVSAGLYLYQGMMLKGHKTNMVTRRLPSLATLQTISRRAIALSFPLYTAGLLLGIIRAYEFDVTGWWADIRVVLAGLVWLSFGIYLVLVYRRDISGKQASWIAVAGLALVVITAIVARTVPIGFHVFGIPVG